MPSRNIVLRDTDGLGELIKERAEAERRSESAIIRSAIRQYLTGDDGGEALRHAVRRAQVLEAKLDSTRDDLAKLRASVAADVTLTWQEDRFTEALEGASPDRPVATARLISVSGWTREWVKEILASLVRQGCITRVKTGWYAPAPGADVREGLRVARVGSPGPRGPGSPLASGKRGTAHHPPLFPP